MQSQWVCEHQWQVQWEMSVIKGYWAAEVMHSSSDLLFPSIWPLQRVPVQYGHVCYVNIPNRSTLTSTECLAFNMTWYHGNWMLRKGSILEYTSPWIHGENVQDHNMLGLEECPSNKTNKLPQLGRHLSCRRSIVYYSTGIGIGKGSIGIIFNCIWCEQFMMQWASV